MCTRTQHNRIDLKQNGKGNRQGKANIYCFYDNILSFKSIQGGKSQIFFNLMCACYVKGRLRMLRPGHKIVLKKIKIYFDFKRYVLIGNVASYVLCILLIAKKSLRHICYVCILVLIIIFSFFIYLFFFSFFCYFFDRCNTLYALKMHIRNHM